MSASSTSWDDFAYTVRLVRTHPSTITAIRNAHPWVLRRSFLGPADVD